LQPLSDVEICAPGRAASINAYAACSHVQVLISNCDVSQLLLLLVLLLLLLLLLQGCSSCVLCHGAALCS
jgi:hypothetical protein